MFNDLLFRLRSLFRRKSVETELDEELRAHLEHQVEKLMKSGLSYEDALRTARLNLGGLEQTKEECRDARGVGFVEMLLQDIAYGFRVLRKDPGFTIVAILTLALGVGANAAIFSVMNTVLLKPLPYPNADRIVTLWEVPVRDPENLNITSRPNFRDWQRSARSFESMAIFDSAGKGYNLSGDGETDVVSGVRVSAQFFDVLGVKPLLGRTFFAEEEITGKDHEVVLAYGLWKRRYHADPSILGKTIRMDKESYTVIGVMPPDFQFKFWSSSRQLWVPGGYTENDEDRGSHSFLSIARLKPDVTFEQAREEMAIIGATLARQYPQKNANGSATAVPADRIGIKGIQATLVTLLIVVGLVLLIACGNVANLTLARTAARQKELAIRQAIGASPRRIARQLLTESVMLAMAGGTAGLLVAMAVLHLAEKVLADFLMFLPFRQVTDIPIDLKVFLFCLGVSCLTGILFGLAPVVNLRLEVNEPLKEEGRTSTQHSGGRLRSILVAAEIALSLVVLAGAGLMLESMARILRVDPGFDPNNVLVLHMAVPQVELYVGPPGLPRFCQDVDEHISAIPGVLSVGAVSHLPMQGGAGRAFNIEGAPDPGVANQPGAAYSVACPGYFRTMSIPMLQGREFTHQDTLTSQQVVIINEEMAHKFWKDKNPLGARFKIGMYNSTDPWMTVVGVAKNTRKNGLDQDYNPEFFRPYTQAGWPTMTLLVRTITAPASFEAPVKEALKAIDPDRTASDSETLAGVVHDSVNSRRLPMILLVSFAVLGVVLAAVGIYGVVNYGVTQRTGEIGVRMALGAQPAHILRMVVGASMKWAALGIVLGILGAFFATRLMTDMLYGVQPGDPLMLVCVAFLLVFVALIASGIPARRATQVDPMIALRRD
jgi:putative ABC transport system permease protein